MHHSTAAVVSRPRFLGVLGLAGGLLAGCATDTTPPLLIEGKQTAQLPRERAYVACVAALYDAYRLPGELRLKPRYQTRVHDEINVREFHLQGDLLIGGDREDAYFICMTERYGRPIEVLGVQRVNPVLFRAAAND